MVLLPKAMLALGPSSCRTRCWALAIWVGGCAALPPAPAPPATSPTPATHRGKRAAAPGHGVPPRASRPAVATATAPRQPTPPPPSSPEATFIAVGDVLLSRQVAGCIATRGDVLAPFRHVAAILDGADFAFGNLESPFSESDRFSLSAANIFNTPPSHIAGLVEHRFRVVNLANNHVLDQGVAGLRFSLSHLADHGILTVGAGLSADQAWRPATLEVRGIRIAFVGASYASVNDDGTIQNRYVARLEDRHRLRRAMERARGTAHVVVATMHAGSEYNPEVHASQVAFARQAIDLGADIVFGAHPHVLQRIERYRGRYIFYSLGNFVFDHVRPGTRDGLAVRTTLRLHEAASPQRAVITRLQLVPIVIEKRCAPRLATGQDAARILAAVETATPTLPLDATPDELGRANEARAGGAADGGAE